MPDEDNQAVISYNALGFIALNSQGGARMLFFCFAEQFKIKCTMAQKYLLFSTMLLVKITKSGKNSCDVIPY